MHRRFSSRLDEFMRISTLSLSRLAVLEPYWNSSIPGNCCKLSTFQSSDPLDGTGILGGLLDWLRANPLKGKLLDEKDLLKLTVVDSVEEVIKHLEPSIKEFHKNAKAEKAAEGERSKS